MTFDAAAKEPVVYGGVILEHFRHPRNHRALATPSSAHEALNPLCGDRVRLEIRVDGDRIRDAAFTANACAVCTAAASLLTERATGMSLADAASIDDATMLASLQSDLPAARIACATLPLRALYGALARLLSASA